MKKVSGRRGMRSCDMVFFGATFSLSTVGSKKK